MAKNTELKNQSIVNVKYIRIGKAIPLNKNPNPLKKNTNFWVTKFAIKNIFPNTIKIVVVIFSKKTRDLRLSENIAIKSSPAELFLFITIFKRDGLNSVPALIKKNKNDNNDQTVNINEALKIEIIAEIIAIKANIRETIAKNLRIALLLSVVVLDLIKSAQASWKSLAKKAMKRIITGPKITNGRTQPIWVFP